MRIELDVLGESKKKIRTLIFLCFRIWIRQLTSTTLIVPRAVTWSFFILFLFYI